MTIDDWLVLGIFIAWFLYVLSVEERQWKVNKLLQSLEQKQRYQATELAIATRKFELEYDCANQDIAKLHQDLYKNFVRKGQPVPDEFYLMWPSQVKGEG